MRLRGFLKATKSLTWRLAHATLVRRFLAGIRSVVSALSLGHLREGDHCFGDPAAATGRWILRYAGGGLLAGRSGIWGVTAATIPDSATTARRSRRPAALAPTQTPFGSCPPWYARGPRLQPHSTQLALRRLPRLHPIPFGGVTNDYYNSTPYIYIPVSNGSRRDPRHGDRPSNGPAAPPRRAVLRLASIALPTGPSLAALLAYGVPPGTRTAGWSASLSPCRHTGTSTA